MILRTLRLHIDARRWLFIVIAVFLKVWNLLAAMLAFRFLAVVVRQSADRIGVLSVGDAQIESILAPLRAFGLGAIGILLLRRDLLRLRGLHE